MPTQANTTSVQPRQPAPLVPMSPSPAVGDAPAKSPEKSPTFGTAPMPTGDDAPVELQLTQASTPEPKVEEPKPAVVVPPAPLPPVAAPEPEPEPEPEPAAAAAIMKPTSWAGMAALHRPKPVEPEKPEPRKAGPPGSGSAAAAEPSNATEESKSSPQVPEDTTASVFVSGVPNGCEKENLEEVMAKFGEVTKIVIKAEKHYAIIDFTDPAAAEKALEAPAPKYDGSILKIEKRREGGDARGKGNRRKGDSGKADGARGRGGGKSQENAGENGFTPVGGAKEGKGGRPRHSKGAQGQSR